MKRKALVYSLLAPVVGLGILGAGAASAHGLMGGWNLSPEDLATRQQTVFQHEAQILGVSIDEVKDAWAQGKTIKDLASEKGVTQDQLQARIKEARLKEMKTRLQTLVDKGVITQAQADQRYSVTQTMIETKKGKGGRMRGGFGW